MAFNPDQIRGKDGRWIKVGDIVRHPFGNNGHSTSAVTKIEGDKVTVTRRGKNYQHPASEVTKEDAASKDNQERLFRQMTVKIPTIAAMTSQELKSGLASGLLTHDEIKRAIAGLPSGDMRKSVLEQRYDKAIGGTVPKPKLEGSFARARAAALKRDARKVRKG